MFTPRAGPVLQRLYQRHRPGLFALQIVSIGGAGLLLAAIAFADLTFVDWRTREMTQEGESALVAAAIAHSSDYVDLLIDSGRLPDGSVNVGPAMTVRIYEQIRIQQDSTARLLELAPRPDTLQLQEFTAAKEVAFRRFWETGNPADFAPIHDIHEELNPLAKQLAAEFSAELRSESAEATRLAGIVRVAVVAAVLVVFGFLAVTTWLVSRRLKAMFDRSEDERRSLVVTTASVERRNEQFRARYDVAADTAEEVDLGRVADSAAASARRLLAADLAIVWLGSAAGLEIAASSAEPALQHAVPSVEPNIVRRVAARGRGLLAGPDMRSDVRDTGVPGTGSGVIVPLVVRSGSVGVIGCWSSTEGAFSEDDRKLLEMLAGQVAPALSAADRYRASEARANSDALTGLHNRHQLTDDILDRFGPALESEQPVTVAMLDVDHFKAYNDRHGHPAGDAALHLLGRIFQAEVRKSDRVYRYGGEEFLFVFRYTSAAAARELIERIRVTVEELTASSTELPAGLTISAGIAAGPEQGSEFPLLVERADAALYRSKVAGRNITMVWGAPEPLREVA